MWLNLGDVIKNAVPDRTGRVLPATLTSGTYELRDLKPGLGHGGNLFEGKLIIDKTWGYLSYGCMICCGFTSLFYDPDPLFLGLGFRNTPQAMATETCSGTLQPVSFETSWWTLNSGVATNSSGTVTAVGAGSTENYGAGLLDSGDGVTAMPEGRSCPITNQTASDTVNVDDFSLSGAQTITDGLQGGFAVTVTGGTASSYQWSFSAPSGAGNNPNVNFTSPASASTGTDGHWFALPNDACSASGNSGYTITAAVTFNDGTNLSKGTQLAITLPVPGGVTDGNFSAVLGYPQMAADDAGTWHVVGLGNLRRDVPTSSTIDVPSSSQFFNKVSQHEQVHVNQWKEGPGHLYGDLFLVSVFFLQIQDFTGTSQQDLQTKIDNARDAFVLQQRHEAGLRQNQAEHEAYAVSDPINPQYFYQNCGRY